MSIALIATSLLLFCFGFVITSIFRGMFPTDAQKVKLKREVRQLKVTVGRLQNENESLKEELSYMQDQLTVYSFQMPTLDTEETNGTQEQ